MSRSGTASCWSIATAEDGSLEDVYVDVETDEPQFATVKEGFIGRHLTFVPLGGIKVGPDGLQVAVAKEQVQDAPNIEQHGEELSQADEWLCTTTTSSTTPLSAPRADAGSPGAERSHPALSGVARRPDGATPCAGALLV